MMPNAENSNSKTTEEYRDALSDRVLSKTLLGWKSFKESTWMIIFKSAAKFRIYRDKTSGFSAISPKSILLYHC